MNNVIAKVGIPTAVDTKSKFHLPKTCFTTSRFFEPRVVYCHETVPSESWHNEVKIFTRLMPLLKPLVASIQLKTRYFFVPMRVIFKNWKDFLAQVPTISQNSFDETETYVPQIPVFTEREISVVFKDPVYSQVSSAASYDFIDDEDKYRKFNPHGSTIYNLLLGLGYNFDLTEPSNMNFSVLPILALLKIWRDWYRSTQFNVSLDSDVYFNPPYDDGREFSADWLKVIFGDIVKMYHQLDYFTSANLQPVSSNQSSIEPDFSLRDITQDSRDSVVDNQNDFFRTPIINDSGTGDPSAVSKYGLDLLNSLTDYVKRHQLAGIQPFNRILAEYGVTLSDEQINYSTFIGEQICDVNIADVVSQSYSDDTVLGELGGKGIGFEARKFNFSTNEFGFIIGVLTVVPRFVYSHGFDRHVAHANRFDFFTPELEHVGVQPIYLGELMNDNLAGRSQDHHSPDQIFGYNSRYAEYKAVAHDVVSGNFAINSRKQLYDGWFLDRLPDYRNVQAISEQFIRANYYDISSPFVERNIDPFHIFVNNDVNAILPMHRLFDDYQFSNEGDDPRKVSINIHGVQKT